MASVGGIAYLLSVEVHLFQAIRISSCRLKASGYDLLYECYTNVVMVLQ